MMSGRRASKVWNFFTPDVDSKLASCIICDRTVSYKSTISNLKSHIRRVHPYQFSEFLTSESTNEQWLSQDSNDSFEQHSFTSQTKQNTLQSSTSSRSNAQATPISIKQELEEAGEKRKELMFVTTPKKPALVEGKSKIDRSLIKLFTRDFQPLTVVEDEGFKEFTNALNPTYQLPTCKMISRKILPNMYDKCLKKIREYVQLEAKNVCISTDCWTSNTEESYVSLTVHFLTDDLELMSVLLDCALFMGPQSARQLADEIQNILVDWDLQDKVILAVSDNNSSNLKDAFECHLHYEHFVCYAHSLNHIVQDALKLFEVTLRKIKNIVMHFDKCPSSAENLKDYQLSSDGGISPKQLIQSVPSRWNSSYYMLKRFVELEECISASMDTVGSDLPIITGEESEACRQLCTVLQPFDEVVQAIRSEKYLSGSMPIVLTKALLIVCEKLSSQPFYQTIVDIIKKLKEGIKDYFGSLEQNEILSLCTFLDPRFKTHYYCEADTTESVKQYIRQLFLTELDSNQSKPEPATSSRGQDQVISVWSVVDSVVENIKPTKGQTSASKANMEIDLYLESHLLPREDCPLTWWRENKWRFPNLAKIFKMKCGVVTTSVPCERLFSDKERILNDRRCSLKAQDVQKIVFLNANDFLQ